MDPEWELALGWRSCGSRGWVADSLFPPKQMMAKMEEEHSGRGWQRQAAALYEGGNVVAGANVHTFTTENWQQEVLNAAEPVLVDFWAVWCAPCRMIAPVVEELAKEYEGRVKVGKLNVDEHPDIATQFGVMSIPTLMVFKGGQPAERIVGFAPKNELKRKLDQVL